MSEAPSNWLTKLRRRFVVFDGPDGCGKTTQFDRFCHEARTAGVEVCPVRDPGGTEIGDQIRRILLDPHNHDHIDVRCEMLLFMASRAQLVTQTIAPALRDGKLVLADRFISSTLAYQGAAGGMDRAEILDVGRAALGNCWPHLVIIFDVDMDTAAARLAASPKVKQHGRFEVDAPTLFSDRMEVKGAQYHHAVRNGYLQQIEQDPQHYLKINAAPDADTVFQSLLAALQKWIEAG